ncbi:hypothetical protein EYF80_010486 [Liparis tanakae]|uniref:Uncharacterized protein n=1 Tax=Liparis tanakae TaxID=230148 RepID=A0A4Z2IN77_9TELE|nr:hypothetical protein EYF80_010486 [Liparis tanakae]
MIGLSIGAEDVLGTPVPDTVSVDVPRRDSWGKDERDGLKDGRGERVFGSSRRLKSVISTYHCCSRGERASEEGNFSIAEAVRQRTGERENKSAPVWSLVTTRGKGIVQKDRAREGRGAHCFWFSLAALIKVANPKCATCLSTKQFTDKGSNHLVNFGSD